MIERETALYLDKTTDPVRIRVSQFDTMWRFVFTILYRDRLWRLPGGASAVLNGRKPDGTVFAYEAEIEDNCVCLDCDIQMTAVAGATVCELSILSEGKVVGTANFLLDVEAAPKAPGDVTSQTTLPAYGAILDRIAEMEQDDSITVDEELSAVSENPVQNKAIKAALGKKWDLLGTELAVGTDLDTLTNGVYYAHKGPIIASLIHSPITWVDTATSCGMTLICFGGGLHDDDENDCQFQIAYDNAALGQSSRANIFVRHVDRLGVFSAWQRLAWTDEIPTVDSAITSGGTNPVQGGAIYTALAGKADSGSVHSIPAGGTTGQVLKKTSGTDYAVEWGNESSGGTYIDDIVNDGDGESIIDQDDIAHIPIASGATYGVIRIAKVSQDKKIKFDANNGIVHYSPALDSNGLVSRDLIPGAEEVTISTAGAVSQALDAGKIYHFTGALTSLTITLNAAATGKNAHYHFDFDSGSTAPTLSLPQTVKMPSGFSVEANKHYEVDILNNYGVVMSWANS